MRERLENWVACLATAAALALGCSATEEVATVRSQPLWQASLEAARSSGFTIESADIERGVISGYRVDGEEGAVSRLTLRFRETPAGYLPDPVIRAHFEPELPGMDSARLDRRFQGRLKQTDAPSAPGRRLAEERDLIEKIRLEMEQERERPVASLPPVREEIPAP